MNVKILPSTAKGTVTAPPSKSAAHRQLILAGLCPEPCEVQNVTPSEDVLATLHCLEALGAKIQKTETGYLLGGAALTAGETPLTLPCGASASTLRFFLPLALVTGRPTLLTGTERLLERPMEVYETLMKENRIPFARQEEGLFVHGRLLPGEYEIPGNVSSQFATGLMLALPFLEAPSELTVLPPVESRPYVDLTLSILRDFGIRIITTGTFRWHIPGKQRLRPHRTTVEGDWSNAAFLEALNLFGGRVKLKGLRELSTQGDKIYRTYYKKLLEGKTTIDLTDCPDLAPILLALAAAGNGAVFTGTHRLGGKESDRGRVMARELEKLGAQVLVEEDRIWVGETRLHAPAEPLQAHGDHRVAMALTVLLSKYGGSLEGAEAVNKSWPEFYTVLEYLGIALHREEPEEAPARTEACSGETEE